MNPSANFFVFGDFNVCHKDWLTYSGETNSFGELCYNFSISNDFTQMVNFPTRIPDCDSHSPALLDLFLLTLVFVIQWLSLHLEILIMLLSQFSVAFAATIVHRNHLFHLYQREKSSDSKVKFRQATNCCKGFLKLPNLDMMIKQKFLLLPKNLAPLTSGELLIVFSKKVNLLFLLYSMIWRCCLLKIVC